MPVHHLLNQRAPSAPVAISRRNDEVGVPTGNSVTNPSVVIRPIFWAFTSVNHSAPSGPVVIPYGSLLAVGIAYSVIAPEVVIRPIFPATVSVNQSAPSGPAVI